MKRHADEQIIYALFDNPDELAATMEDLTANGISVDDVSLLMSEDTHDRDFKMLERTQAQNGATAGGMLGGALGGILGGLVAIGTTFTGGLGLLVLGPALAFAATGSLIGGLIGYGVPQDEAKRINDALHMGRTMVAVHTHNDAQIATAKRILQAHHGELDDAASASA